MAASVSAPLIARSEVVYRCLWLTVLFAPALDVVAVWFYMFWCACCSWRCTSCWHASEQPLTTQKQDFVSLFFNLAAWLPCYIYFLNFLAALSLSRTCAPLCFSFLLLTRISWLVGSILWLKCCFCVAKGCLLVNRNCILLGLVRGIRIVSIT